MPALFFYIIKEKINIFTKPIPLMQTKVLEMIMKLPYRWLMSASRKLKQSIEQFSFLSFLKKKSNKNKCLWKEELEMLNSRKVTLRHWLFIEAKELAVPRQKNQRHNARASMSKKIQTCKTIIAAWTRLLALK